MVKRRLSGMNLRRAGWAKTALLAFCKETGQVIENDGLTEVAGDLVADLMHLAHLEKVSFEDIMDKAHYHHKIEIKCKCRKCGALFDAEADGSADEKVCGECE